MERGKPEILRLIEQIRREIQFDTFSLNRLEQDRADLKLRELKEFFDGLYDKR